MSFLAALRCAAEPLVLLLLGLHVPQPRLDVLHLVLQVTLLLPQVLHVLPQVEVLLRKL